MPDSEQQPTRVELGERACLERRHGGAAHGGGRIPIPTWIDSVRARMVAACATPRGRSSPRPPRSRRGRSPRRAARRAAGR
ncbi:hypothetical protein NKG05_14130 [Oerskovia sp. M15]